MIDKEEISEIIQDSKSYLNNQIELNRLKATEQASLYSSKVIAYLILGSVSLLFLICVSLFLGFILSEYFANFATGFGLIALAYFAILVLLFAFKRQIIGKPIQNKIIRDLYGK
jgi:polyferredoxin